MTVHEYIQAMAGLYNEPDIASDLLQDAGDQIANEAANLIGDNWATVNLLVDAYSERQNTIDALNAIVIRCRYFLGIENELFRKS